VLRCNKTHFYHAECLQFLVRRDAQRIGRHYTCSRCRFLRHLINTRLKNFEIQASVITSGKSKTPFRQLSSEQKKMKLKQLAEKVKFSKRKIKRLRIRLKEKFRVDSVIERQPFALALANICQHVSNEENLCELIRNILVSQLKQNQQNDINVVENVKVTSSFISEQICSHVTRLRSGSKCIRYSKDIISISLSIFQRNPKSYLELQSLNLVILPSVHTLSKYAQAGKLHAGICPETYTRLITAWHNYWDKKRSGNTISSETVISNNREKDSDDEKTDSDENGSSDFELDESETHYNSVYSAADKNYPILDGILMVDEVKISGGIAYNASSKKLIGFAPDKVDLSSLFDDEIKYNKKVNSKNKNQNKIQIHSKPVSEIATSISQWKISSEDESFGAPLEFFPSNGVISYSTLARQFLHVSMCCDLVGVRIRAFCTDAGSANSKLFHTLRKTKIVNLQKNLLSHDETSMIDLMDPSTNVYLYHCMVHCFKALRNTLSNSSAINAKKRANGTSSKSLRTTGNPFGWETIYEVFEEDNKRAARGLARLTRLTKDCVELDSWKKMRVGSAKKIFCKKTISAILCFVVENYLPKNQQEKYIVNHAEQRDSSWQQRRGHCPFGIMIRRTEDLMKLFPVIPSHLFVAQYLSYGHELFNEFFLHSEKYVAKSNIETITKNIQFCLDYFVEWRRQQINRRTAKEMDWMSTCIATETWTNLLSGASGFINATNDQINRKGFTTRRSPLTANTSSLESMFSNLRGMCIRNEVSVANYSSALSKIHMRMNRKMVNFSNTYTANDSVDESFVVNLELPKAKSKRIKTIYAKYSSNLGSRESLITNLPKFSNEPEKLLAKELAEIAETDLGILVKQRLIDDGYCTMLDGTVHESWLHEILTGEYYVAYVFEVAVRKVFEAIAEHVFHQRTANGYTDTQILKLHLHADMIDCIPANTHSERALFIEACSLEFRRLLKMKLMNFTRENDYITRKPITENDEMHEVYCFFGFALFSTRNFAQKKIKLCDAAVGENRNQKKQLYSEVLELLKVCYEQQYTDVPQVFDNETETETEEIDEDTNLDTIVESEIDQQFEAMFRDVEPFSFQLLNQGGLLKPAYRVHEFAKAVLKVIRKKMAITELTEDSMQQMFTEIKDNKEHDNLWLSTLSSAGILVGASVSETAVNETKKILVQKLINSRGCVRLLDFQEQKNMKGADQTIKQGTRTLLKAFGVVKQAHNGQ
jgi:hypothetical protein